MKVFSLNGPIEGLSSTICVVAPSAAVMVNVTLIAIVLLYVFPLESPMWSCNGRTAKTVSSYRPNATRTICYACDLH
jgi:hypothetical protein